MKRYHYNEKPLQIFGIPFFEKNGKLERLPEKVRKAVPTLDALGRRALGARLCFQTNSKQINVHLGCKEVDVDLGLSIYQGHSAFVFIGDRPTSYYAGHVFPKAYGETQASRIFEKSDKMEDITIWLPRNSIVTSLYIEVEDDATVLAPTPYRYEKPILYYGSSITATGCTRVCNGYNALISRWLDVDFYNFGFCGSARAESEIAEYINSIEKSIFVYDYDHNAPTVEYLEQTHERFFKQIREHDPKLPIVMLSRPNFKMGTDENDEMRRDIIRKTYENAVAQGDNNVYFIDGETLFGDMDRELCTIDTIHPNDLGFYRMAERICPLIRTILEKLYS